MIQSGRPRLFPDALKLCLTSDRLITIAIEIIHRIGSYLCRNFD